MAHVIQVGAFSTLDNAVRLTEMLQSHDLNAFHFIDQTGLYKVRFGNLPSREMAREKAEELRASGIIPEYYVIGPEQVETGEIHNTGKRDLRDAIVASAESFIGVPYRWGGSSLDEGFDCSGLAMAVYQLNGLELPRSSKEQWRTGARVERSRLSKADLVFFSTAGWGGVSHVGIYVGDGKFIHAPGKNKKIRVESLQNRYYDRCYVGSRTYF
jgi:cell wall-associated NlpC family hydrolase